MYSTCDIMLVTIIINNSFLFAGTSTPPPDSTTLTSSDEISTIKKQPETIVKVDPLLENKLLECLCNSSLTVPVDSMLLTNTLTSKVLNYFIIFRVILF